MEQVQPRKIPQILGANFYAHTPCSITWDQNENGANLTVTVALPVKPMKSPGRSIQELAEDGVDKLRQLTEAIRAGANETEAKAVRAEVLSSLVKAVAGLSAALNAPDLHLPGRGGRQPTSRTSPPILRRDERSLNADPRYDEEMFGMDM